MSTEPQEVFDYAAWERVAQLMEEIREDFACSALSDGTPCRTCRFDALPLLAELLTLHNYQVSPPPTIMPPIE